MRWLFLIFFLFPSIALAGQAEQEEVDQVLEGLKPCLSDINHKLSPVTNTSAFLSPILDAKDLGTL